MVEDVQRLYSRLFRSFHSQAICSPFSLMQRKRPGIRKAVSKYLVNEGMWAGTEEHRNILMTVWTGLNTWPHQIHHCFELFKNCETVVFLAIFLFFMAHCTSSSTPWNAPGWFKGMWSSGKLAILVQQSPGISFCLVYLRLGSKATEFDSLSDHSLGGNLIFRKAIRGHWKTKSPRSSEEFPSELLRTWETGWKLLLGGRDSVCMPGCHTHAQCWVPQREGTDPTGKSFVMWVPRPGPPNVEN